MGLLSPNKLDNYLGPTLAQDQLLMGLMITTWIEVKKMSPPTLAYLKETCWKPQLHPYIVG